MSATYKTSVYDKIKDSSTMRELSGALLEILTIQKELGSILPPLRPTDTSSLPRTSALPETYIINCVGRYFAKMERS